MPKLGAMQDKDFKALPTMQLILIRSPNRGNKG
jgi:hypothetical protein